MFSFSLRRLLSRQNYTPTPHEKVAPRFYIRYIFPFQLKENYDPDEVTRVLKAGSIATKKRIGIIGRLVAPDNDLKQKGCLKLLDANEEEHPTIVVRDLRGEDDFPLAYDELKAMRFPVNLFRGKTLCREREYPAKAERYPVSAVQANYIRGGLLLSVCLHHAFADGKSVSSLIKIWSEECRKAQGLPIDKPFVMDDGELLQGRDVVSDPKVKKASWEDHQEFLQMPNVPLPPPSRTLLNHAHRSQIFSLSTGALSDLKRDAQPSKANHPVEGVTFTSTNDALSALIWRSSLMARVNTPRPPSVPPENKPNSVLNIAINGRAFVNPPIHPFTVGCFLQWSEASVAIKDVVDGTLNLADIACLIRAGLQKVDKNYTMELASLVQESEDVNLLTPSSLPDIDTVNYIHTSWATFTMYEEDWGPLLGHIEAVRVPRTGMHNGIQIILPKLRTGAMEVMFCFNRAYLPTLLEDPVLAKYAVPS